MINRVIAAKLAVAVLVANAPALATPSAPSTRAAGLDNERVAKSARPVGNAHAPAARSAAKRKPGTSDLQSGPAPGGRYYRPPPPPPGGWRGGYYPPPHYIYYDDGPSAGEVIAGVAVTGSLIALLAKASNDKAPEPTTATVSSVPPPPPAPFVPPPGSTGKPAKIDVDLRGLTPDARPSASTCIAEASRQIGATGGLEIGIASFDKLEPGNGGYRFGVTLLATYPDAKRKIPMYCRATPTTLVELKFG